MKTTMTIAVFAVAAVIAVSAITINTISSSALATGVLKSESGYMSGHVEYVVRDSNGNIKAYLQGDNMVVDRGDDCVAQLLFGQGTGTCSPSATNFRFIGIGNSSVAINNDSTTIGDAANTSVDGLMAIREDNTPSQPATSNNGTSVTLSTPSAFTFGAGNATIVRQAAIFDATCTGMASGYCTGAAGNMFAAQTFSSPLTVTSGDSLSVTWTITVGNSQ